MWPWAEVDYENWEGTLILKIKSWGAPMVKIKDFTIGSKNLGGHVPPVPYITSAHAYGHIEKASRQWINASAKPNFSHLRGMSTLYKEYSVITLCLNSSCFVWLWDFGFQILFIEVKYFFSTLFVKYKDFHLFCKFSRNFPDSLLISNLKFLDKTIQPYQLIWPFIFYLKQSYNDNDF